MSAQGSGQAIVLSTTKRDPILLRLASLPNSVGNSWMLLGPSIALAQPVGHSDAYVTLDQLDALVSEMYHGGVLYSEAVHEFKKQFIVAVLRETRGNKVQAAREIGVHRNTMDRTVAALGIDVRSIRAERRPPRGTRPAASVRKVVGHP